MKKNWFKSNNPEDEDDISNFMYNLGREVGEFGRDKGQFFPSSDSDDFQKGVRFVPGEVTLARRRGERVTLNAKCYNSCCWYWQFQDGKRIYHFERYNYEQLRDLEACPNCGNTHFTGLSPEENK